MYSVLLAEDETNIRSGLKKLVEEVIGGFKVSAECKSGTEALAYLKENIPDVVITDIRMPGASGIEVVKWLKEHYPHVPIMILSGYSEFEYARQAMRYGVVDYLLKPLDRVEFTQCLDRIKADLDKERSRLLDLEDHAHYVIQKDKELGTTDHKSQEKLESQKSSVNSENHDSHHVIRKVKELIHGNLHQDVSLQYIADHVNMNYQYLSVLFKSETNQNFSDYVKEARINKAKQLLKTTNLKIYEVSQLCGYASSKHFMTVFKQSVDITPTEYRRQLNE